MVRASIGFTLLELLVVIAIIATLAALLVPTLQNAKGTANNVVCMNNLRQIGQSILLFSTDNNGHFPGSAKVGGVQVIDWQDILNDNVYKGQQVVQKIYTATNKQSLFCPGLRTEQPTGPPYHVARGYGINAFVRNNQVPAKDPPFGSYDSGTYKLGPPIELFDRHSLPRKVLVGEMWFPQDDFYFNDTAPSHPIDPSQMNGHLFYPAELGRQSYRHKMKMNVLYMDGHVQQCGLDGYLNLLSSYHYDSWMP